ncbi:photosystem II protein (plasmid) [Acaryochloris sp. 'Moss Beach']|uniref:photosystem II complex extrinsic protein PsbU n=1 Tax=Acaryochloris sp. 'Moss Beach' TaxID=2740837 RepID=UPI001EEF6836|nr:photosystem II complex extrinsic protein PsbU [Acaryochloris sp. 'Moss Beach']UJB72565.1 photosystem II protein [Acaryochloris sp. 'Moss Beach']
MKYFQKIFIVLCLTVLIFIGITSSFQIPVNAGKVLEQSFENMEVSDSPVKQSKNPCIPIDEKIDLNNANAIAFKNCPGYYPTLAKKIINNGPYETVEEVLNIRGLNVKQKKLLEDKLDFFAVSKPNTDLATRMPPRPMMR